MSSVNDFSRLLMLSVLSCGGQIVNFPGGSEAALVSATAKNLPQEYSLFGYSLFKNEISSNCLICYLTLHFHVI